MPALLNGNVKLVGTSLYPIEKNFFSGRLGTGCITDALSNFVTGVGRERVEFVQQNIDYFKDLLDEYNFYEQLNGSIIHINGRKLRYGLVRDAGEIEGNLNDNDIETVSVFFTVEGAHIFNSHANRRPEGFEILANVYKLKRLNYRPLYISMGHHFYNEMCGHARSLTGTLGKLLDQTYGVDTGITTLGFTVIDSLLDNSSNDRILIDVKHMSLQSRKQYYQFIKNKPDVPIIVSHGAVNGLASFNDIASATREGNIFNQEDINFFDDEILKINDSHGIFGIQLDERRIADKKMIKKTFFNPCKRRMLFKKSGLIWNQVRHIAELLDKNGKNAWNLAVIGSDFDGIVDPLNGFWTAEDFPDIAENLLVHAKAYMHSEGKKLAVPENRHSEPEQIIKNLMSDNVMHFLKEHFH